MSSDILNAPSTYRLELEKLEDTYKSAMTRDVAPLKRGLSAASGSSVIAVGSGASFTTASLLCGFHETYTGQVSRASTPLELVCNPTLAASCPVFLISSEGKNPDIVEALSRARRTSARAIHVIINREACPILSRAKELTDIDTHIYPMLAKDGYLGTNSLLMNAVLIARAYQELDNEKLCLPSSIDGLRLDEMSIDQWILSSKAFCKEAFKRQTLIIVYSPPFRPIAVDLESKLSEAALLNCQLTDIRSFAHGRHLWLAERPSDCSLIALVDPSLRSLWKATQDLLPAAVPKIVMQFAGKAPCDLLTGLVAQMLLVAEIAEPLKKDPGQPVIQDFGRVLHYLDVKALIPHPIEDTNHSIKSKQEVLSSRWPITKHEGALRRALASFHKALLSKVFKCIVFDYDGVLCRSQERDAPPSQPIIDEILRLCEGGVILGIASGRGGSVREKLLEVLPETVWKKIILGLYNAGHVGDMTVVPHEGETSEYLSHVTRIVRRLQSIGVPINSIHSTHPYQVSIRFNEGTDANRNWFVIADALRQAGLDLLRVVRSKHSVDILGTNVSKSHLVAHIVQNHKVDPHEVLTIGDQGAWPGNDVSLLDHRFSLSVDDPSRRLDRGWKLAPSHKRDVDATLWYLKQIELTDGGTFKLRLPKLE